MNKMISSLKNKERTNYCGEFDISQVNKAVIAMGWVSKRRDFGNLVFVDLRDKTGIVQVVFDRENFKEDFFVVDSLRNEYVICVEGKVVEREKEAVNDKLKTGNIEIKAANLTLLSSATKQVPFSLEDSIPSDYNRLKNRYLDLRREHLQRNIKLRYELSKVARNYLDQQRFTEIETPFLGKPTPEGARDYVIPSRTFPNKFFTLPQSPQLYKQLLMIAGFDKYFQITKCFRDEDLRADRQPEFTQLDIELSFVDKEEQVMQLIEGLIKEVFEKTINYKLPEKFKILTYQEAMNRYGSDKPDTRFGLELVDISDIAQNCSLTPFKEAVSVGGSVRLINGKGILNKVVRKDLEGFVTFAKGNGAAGMSYITYSDGEIKSPLLKFFTESQLKEIYKRTDFVENDCLFLVADNDNDLVLTTLGRLRLHIAEKLNLIDNSTYDVLWVKDFPLFEYDKEEKRYVAVHHPFTSPKDEDIHLLETEPQNVRAKAYDIVINGYEAGGGSIRIYNHELQQKMFKALGFTEEKIREQFGFFVDAFQYGTPPHGGIALGFDRLVMLLAKTTDIKDVIAFPKIQTAMDVMAQAPNDVSQSQLDELHISLIKPKKEDK